MTTETTQIDNFFSMDTAPKDGTEIILLIQHENYAYATDKDKSEWRQECKARWTEFNKGGWVWEGICGEWIGWKPLVEA